MTRSTPTTLLRLALVPALALALAASACGNSDRQGGTSDATETRDSVSADVPGSDTGTTDSGGGDTVIGTDTIDPNPADFQNPCSSNADCVSGWCVPSPRGLECTKGCGNGCPPGWVCGPVENRSTDFVNVCLDRSVTLCHPCFDDADCNQWTPSSNNKCLSQGDAGSFCGITCVAGGDPCPPDYRCDAQPGGGGQCVPDSGTCACNALASELQLVTVCGSTNAQGTCEGFRGCGSSGLSACSADTPAAETCNGVDDDCDGSVDEGLSGGAACMLTNDAGSCPGQTFCVAGAMTCVGVPPSAEVCDGLDQNCDGVTDDGFPDFDDDLIADCVDTDDDADGTPDAQDCAPFDAAISKSATETCNNVDDDCDGLTDEEGADGCTEYYQDIDGDQRGSDDVPSRCLCAPDALSSYDATVKGDCADLNPNAYFGAEETCNGIDDSCDNNTDEGVQAPCGGCVNICLLQSGVEGDVAFAPTAQNSQRVTTAAGALVITPGQTSGWYRFTRTGWPLSDTFWNLVFVDSETPAGTWYELRYRVAASAMTLGAASWIGPIGPFPPGFPPIDIDLMGGVVEIEVALYADAIGKTPQINSVTLLGEEVTP